MQQRKNETREEFNARQREHRRKTGNAVTKRYEKTKKGFLVRMYRNMYSRVTGIQHKNPHLYKGLEILPREEFYAWAFDSRDFHDLWDVWVKAGHKQRLVPSVDRIDSGLGYFLDNMEWVPFHENCRRGTYSKFYGKYAHIYKVT